MSTHREINVVIIGAGHNGLAMSAQLTRRNIDHVVLERGQVGESWRSERWDSFTLLTPNWQTKLPGSSYEGKDPNGFMAASELVALFEAYATTVAAPVETGVTVRSVGVASTGYEVVTDRETWSCACVVLAAGFNNLPTTPDFAGDVPAEVVQINPLEYRNPDQLPEGEVLVVGAAATGMQLADEIHASGRPVTLSVGEHVRMPRLYRGLDIQHWMESIGRLDERYDETDEILKARKGASPQLIGTPERRSLDLNALTDVGVKIRGRLGAVRDGVAMFSGGLRNHCALADQKLTRLLDDIDEWIEKAGIEEEVEPPERYEPTRVEKGAPLTLDLTSGAVRTVVWATGFRPDHSWVQLDVFDDQGRIIHDGGVVNSPGVYVLGATFLRRRRSSFIHGAPSDTDDLAAHLCDYLSELNKSKV